MTDSISSARASEKGDERFLLAYEQLRRLAAGQLRRERGARTLQPTALVHEAYLKLRVPDDATSPFENQNHFIACAARAMRQVLIDHARRGSAAKRRGERVDWTLSAIPDTGALSPDEFLDLDRAMEKLGEQQPNGLRHVRLVELIWLGGMEMTAAAEVLGISRRQAHRDWAWARTWLAREMGRVN
jgi:RNA polymerase sigma factor (TIGR02999 family)